MTPHTLNGSNEEMDDITPQMDTTDGHLKALIDQGVADALEESDTDRSINGDDSHDSGMGVRRQAPFAREYTYSDFMKCKLLYFKGTEGVVELTQWFERMETNSHVRTVGHDVAYAMTWTNLKKMMTDKYSPRGEIKKLEVEMWNLKIKGTDVISTLAERQAENKRKLDNNNQAQQQPPKKQGVAIAYTAGPGEKKEYAGTLPLCNKCKFHHNGQCTIKCINCNRVGHLTRDRRSPAATNNQRNSTCYECGNQRHYRSDCPKLKNQNHRNQAGGTGAREMVHALGGGETNQDLNGMKDDINAWTLFL
ncbi:RNA-directed DNA polymerase, eukaryota [Tanacetum coccineum]|uniref:RNA-directed DNA polymerase, eukaryota n=1 Tax=Tanacetum coccineum TaxID=301880 RepID=A0ABQ5DY23_9ASTR